MFDPEEADLGEDEDLFQIEIIKEGVYSNCRHDWEVLSKESEPALWFGLPRFTRKKCQDHGCRMKMVHLFDILRCQTCGTEIGRRYKSIVAQCPVQNGHH